VTVRFFINCEALNVYSILFISHYIKVLMSYNNWHYANTRPEEYLRV